MKIIKPLKLGLIHRTYGYQGAHHFAVKPIVFFELQQPDRIVPEAQAWQRLMNQLPQHQVFDEGMPKASPEVLLYGSAHSPQGKRTTQMLVTLSIGKLTKSLQVTGDRIWQKGFFSRKATNPAPFDIMPLTWERAFGGQQNPSNPVGQGALSQGESGETLVALPNVEYVGQTLTSPKKHVQAAGYGPLSSLWAPRTDSDKLFDQAYMDSTFPAFPDALDFARFNMAPLDQRLDQLIGNEIFSLGNLHPQHPIIDGVLPPFRPRVFTQIGSDFAEMAVKPETVWFLPSANLGAVIYCGQCPVIHRHAQLALNDLMLAYERVGDAPRTLGYYQHVLKLRTDPQTSYQYVTDESQLSPVKSASIQQAESQSHAAHVEQLSNARAKQWQAQQKAFKAAHGIEAPAGHAPPPIDPRSVIAPAAISNRDYSLAPVAAYAQEKQQSAQAKLANAQQKRAASPTEASATQKPMSEDDVVADALAKTRDGQVRSKNQPKVVPTGRGDMPTDEERDRMALMGRAKATAPKPLSFRKAQEAGAALREVVQQRQQDGESLAFRDFTGADLSALDFSGVDLQGSIFECCDLSECVFAGSKLSGASFVGATLDGTDFTGAVLTGANFCYARGEHTVFEQSDLCGGVIFQKACLTVADFRNAMIETASIIKSDLRCADFSGAKISRATILKSCLNGCIFDKTSIDASTFMDSSLRRTQWHGCHAERCVILNSQMQMANMHGGNLVRCQIAGDSWLTAASFDETKFSHCGLRSANGTGVSFAGAGFESSDLAMTHFPSADFSKAVSSDCLASDSNFREGNFTGAMLSSTNFAATDFSGAELKNTNFYQSDVLLAQLSEANHGDASDIMPTKVQRLAHERG